MLFKLQAMYIDSGEIDRVGPVMEVIHVVLLTVAEVCTGAL